MNCTDDEENAETFPNLSRTYHGDVANEHVSNFLVPVGRPTEQQHRASGCNYVTDSNYRLLRNPRRPLARYGKYGCAEKGYAKPNRVRGDAFGLKLQQNRDTNA